MRRLAIVFIGALVCVAAVGAGFALTRTSDDASGTTAHRAATEVAPRTTPSTTPSTAPTTLPPLTTPPTSASGIVQPIEARLPLPPPQGVGPGASGPTVQAYQERLAFLRFDPGPVDGQYGAAVAYAVQGLQKFKGLPVTGVIGTAEVDALNHFTYPEPMQPGAEPNRTEVDIARQTLTLYESGQPRLLTTASSGSGETYCYDQPLANPTEHVCEVANTPSGRFTYYLHRTGWDEGVLGGLYNPFYFNGGVAVHGALSVPIGPASHGCVRIPMHIAEYFSDLVRNGDPVYVVGGTPFQVLSRESLVPTPAPFPGPTSAASDAI
jgi:peptidoglycan hydrolase-like protein with peptidoglycan-binding domain